MTNLHRRTVVIIISFLSVLIRFSYLDVIPELVRGRKKEKLVVLVQGSADNFPKWYERLKAVSSNYSGQGIALVYASYDMPVNDALCTNTIGVHLHDEHTDHNCQALFIPNSTWTEGRNALAHAAHCWEKRRSALFSYWIFCDDDVELVCRNGTDISEVECWGRFFGFVEYQGPLSHAATIAVKCDEQFKGQFDGVLLTNSYDAILNAYNREFVPFLLPYVTKMSDTLSWWLSQAVHFSLMRSCFPMAGLVPMHFDYRNPTHRVYPRGGLVVENVAQLIADNYDQYISNPIQKPLQLSDLDQFAETRWFSSAQNSSHYVDDQRSKMNRSCDPLIQRFKDWLDTSICL